jgi:hypothetical protein
MNPSPGRAWAGTLNAAMESRAAALVAIARFFMATPMEWLEAQWWARHVNAL